MFDLFSWNEFRDGVSESQFNQVLNIELNQIIEVSAPSNISMHAGLSCSQPFFHIL